MTAATSAIVREEHQTEICIYCGAKLINQWRCELVDGLEYKVTECENGHEARIKITKDLNIEQFINLHRLDHKKDGQNR